MSIQKLLALALAFLLGMGLTACGASGGEDTAETAIDTGTDSAGGVTASGSQQVVVEGFDWGPAVTKTILTLDRTVSAVSVSAESFAVAETKEAFNWPVSAASSGSAHTAAEASRTVTAAYPCDAEGNQTEGDSNRIALELSYGPTEGSPYCYDGITGQNTVCDPYELEITLTENNTLTDADGAAITALNVDAGVELSEAQVPQLAGADLSGSFTDAQGITLTYGSYVPAEAEDGEKHPLVIWLHGAGEGGTDPSIPLLGNKVTALYGEEFQSVMGGAYVLTPQTPQFWLCYDAEGSWQDNPGTDSVYLSTLMELIEEYVAANPAIDTDRIYVGGCSNGGYMTMDLILNDPDYFAAAFPICEAYLDAGITDEQLEGIRDLPIWFVYAENDTVVLPDNYEKPTIARLQAMGADVHTSVFEDVHDTTGLYTGEDGEAYQYIGHWSWLYFFNNQCEENGVNLWQWLSEQSR